MFGRMRRDGYSDGEIDNDTERRERREREGGERHGDERKKREREERERWRCRREWEGRETEVR